MPEVDSLELPLGIQAYRDIRLLFGNPPKHVAALKLRPVIVQNEGVWYPAFVDEKSGLTIPQHVLSKHKRRAPRKHGYRNLYACDFVEAGDILGAIVPEGTKAFPIVVRAPVSGFILAFEVEQYTQVVPNANIMFLGESVDLKPVYYLEEGGIVGIFRFPADQTSPVGKIVQKNSILCEVDSITHPREVPMPETGLVLRQYKKVGDAVQYMARDSDTKELKHEVLFLYLPLQPLNS